MKNIKSYNDFLIESNLNDDINEGKLKNLTLAGIITAAGLASGNKAYSQNRFKDNIKDKIETIKSNKSDRSTDKDYKMETYQQAYKRMSQEKGFGEGKSQNLEMSRKIALTKARGNLAKSESDSNVVKTTMTGVNTIEEKTYRDEDGKYVTIIVVDYR